MNDPKSIQRHVFLCLIAVSTTWLSLGCRPSVEESNDRSLLEAIGEHPLEANVEAITVPEGNTEDLFQFMDEIHERELGSFDLASREMTDEYVLALNRVMKARIAACDKILSTDDDAKVLVLASRLKLQSLQTLAVMNDEDSRTAYDGFVSELKASGNDELERLVLVAEFEERLNSFLSSPDADESEFLSQLDTFLQQPDLSTTLFETGRRAAGVVFQNGHVDLSADILQRLGEHFQNHADPELAANATALIGEAIQVRITRQVDQVLIGNPQGITALVDTVSEALNDSETRDDVMGYALQAALTLESRGQFKSANQVYEVVQSDYESTDSELMESLNRSVELAQQRMNSIGQPLKIDGVLLDGKPFDWEAYRGNFVVVCFWQSWHNGWVTEVRKLRQAIAPFRDQGVKIITVNLDDDRNGLERYLQETPLSLPIIVNPDVSAAGFENPNALRCGVEAVPYSLLISPQGVVIDIHARGDRLRASLEERLGPPDAAQQSIDSTSLRYVAFTSPDDDDSEATGPDSDQASLEERLQETNPYSPPADATSLGLIDFILEMQDKPRSIQRRKGFSAGIVEASDKVIGSDAKGRWKTIALLAKTKYLHRDASFGDQDAEEALRKMIERWKADPRESVASEMRFLQLEQQALNADETTASDLPQLLDDLIAFFEQQSLNERHLRIASQSVHAVNRLDVSQRESYFERLGEQFAKSDDKQLAAYGKRIGKSAASQSDHLNEMLALSGATADGVQFDWDAYRGNWVVVDFWATWCGPCRQAMPALRQLAKEHEAQGLRVVGVNLDEDLKAVAEFLSQTELPWTNIVGPEASEVAKKYDVRAIPNLMLVDEEGRIRFVSHKVEEMAERIDDEVGVGT